MDRTARLALPPPNPTMAVKVCSHRGCYAPAPFGVGWGLGSGLVQWFCGAHFVAELARAAGLLGAARRRAA